MRTLLTTTACAAALALSGCGTHLHSLLPEESDPAFATGWLKHEGPEKPELVLEYKGKRFEARGFPVERTRNLAQLRRRYAIDRRHWDRIFSGLDENHDILSAEAKLAAADGAPMRCALAWQEDRAPAGACTSAEGVRLAIRFE